MAKKDSNSNSNSNSNNNPESESPTIPNVDRMRAKQQLGNMLSQFVGECIVTGAIAMKNEASFRTAMKTLAPKAGRVRAEYLPDESACNFGAGI